MSDAEHMSRKELLQPNRMEKQLYSFVDHAYRKKSLYISAVIALVVLILGIWGGWKYLQNERITQANLYHLARANLNNPILTGRKIEPGD
jgi:predicted negative regulator of RcsB-dependent stress response